MYCDMQIVGGSVKQAAQSRRSLYTSFSKHLLKMGVRATGFQSFKHVILFFFGMNGRMIRFSERWAGEGFVCVPEGGVAVIEYTISTCVDGDVLKVFWSYRSEIGFIKAPRNNKSFIWVHGFLLKSSQVTFIYIALLTIQNVTKHCTISK